jgi:hypothetical protein
MTGPDAHFQAAIFLEEARPVEIAPLILSAYQLTPRASHSSYCKASPPLKSPTSAAFPSITVQDYLKSIFDKVACAAGGSWVAQLFRQHYLQ